MSYAANRLLWEIAADGDLAETLRSEPDTAFAGRDLTDEERAAFTANDIRGLYLLGVHPFLLFNYALRLNGGFTHPFADAYIEQLKGLDATDLET